MRYTVEDSRHERGRRKPCEDRDAHREHIWLYQGTEWYCPGFLGNLLPPEPTSEEYVDALYSALRGQGVKVTWTELEAGVNAARGAKS